MKYRVIGDVHGKWLSYWDICDSSPLPTIQVGDFGLGFDGQRVLDEFITNFQDETNGRHRFIRGNHDNPEVCKSRTLQYINDGQVIDNMMFVGGAWSIDHAFRTEGIDWWMDEELSQREFSQVIDVYAMCRPEIMITHDAPDSISKEHIINKGLALSYTHMPTRTGQALQAMFEYHKPKIWMFGHWHNTLDVEVDGTHFICLNELEYRDIDTETFEVSEPMRKTYG